MSRNGGPVNKNTCTTQAITWSQCIYPKRIILLPGLLSINQDKERTRIVAHHVHLTIYIYCKFVTPKY